MEKHLNKIVIGAVIIILVFIYLIIDMMMDNRNTTQVNQPVQNNNSSEETYSTKDYVISESVQIYPDTNAQLGDASRILASVDSFVVENNEVTAIKMIESGNVYELKVSDMRLFELQYDGASEVYLTFRTGGYARLTVGGYAYLYKSDDGTYSFDERIQHGGTMEKLTGTITGFEFATMQHQNAHVVISYIVLNDGTIKLPVSVLNSQSITSAGEMTVYYIGDVENGNIYGVNTGDNFSIQVTGHDGTVQTYQKGGQINVQRSSKKGYWELEQIIDATRYKATVTDITFDFEGQNITGINYLVLTKEDGSQEYMTLFHTQAHYGIPYGNYRRIFTGEGNDIVISDVEPYDDFRMVLNYNNSIEITVRLGTEVWIHKNTDDIYVMDYEYTYNMHESEK